MYNANLNYSQLKSHINALTSQGLLEKKLNKYVTTERGYRFLELFAQINDLLDEFTNLKWVFDFPKQPSIQQQSLLRPLPSVF